MAIAAFKSTTKRVCSIGGGNDLDNSSIVPLQSSASINKPSHRRARSLSDFGSRYLSDSASAASDANSRHLDSLFRKGRNSNQHQSDDSESDADSVYSRHTHRSRQNAEIGASRKASLQNSKTKRTTQAELKRTKSQIDRSHKEISDFLSCLGDESDTESVFTRFTSRNHRRVDDHSDSESVFTRLTSRNRRADDRSDSESVFSRLTRPRQSLDLGPPRTGAGQSGKGKGTRAGALRRSTSQVDLSSSSQGRGDQSETESTFSRYSTRQSADFGASRVSLGLKKGGPMRRSASQMELSAPSAVFEQPSCPQDDADSSVEVYYDLERNLRKPDDEVSSDHPEEEKTIRAVHTQNKDPGAPELDAIFLYDAMRVEMRKAVSDIRNEIEQKSLGKELVLPSPKLPVDLRIIVPGETDDNEAAVDEVRREYAAKLEQSEKRAQDLWTQLAVEERRCHDLVSFVKELLPTQAGSRSKQRAPPPRPMGPEVEKQLVSQCLDADAQRYFDECVSISGLDIMSLNDTSSCGVGYQESETQSQAWSVKDLSFSPRKKDLGRTNEKKMAMLEPLISFCAQIEQTGRGTARSSNFFARALVNNDGLVLPWLQWETDIDFSPQDVGKDKKKDGNMIGSLTATSSSNRGPVLARSKSSTWREGRPKSDDQEESHSIDFPLGVSGLGCVSNADISCWKNVDFGHIQNVASSSNDRGRYEGRFDVEMFVLQRMWLRHRIKDGRLLICGGIRF